MTAVSVSTAEPITPPIAEHGEGPVWCASDSRIRWVDMLRGDILSAEASGESLERHHVADLVAAFRPRRTFGYVVATSRGFATLDVLPGPLTEVIQLWTDAGVRMNEGACDPAGSFYCGSMAEDAAEGRGSLYKLNPDGSVTTILSSVTISNGLSFSADGSVAYYVDSPTNTVSRYRVDRDTGAWSDPTPVVEIDRDLGVPDGICLDRDGGVWVALWDGGAVHRYDSNSGNLTHRVQVPVSRPTACALGGPELSTLFITTSALDSDPASDPLAGALFRSPAPVSGTLPFTFAG